LQLRSWPPYFCWSQRLLRGFNIVMLFTVFESLRQRWPGHEADHWALACGSVVGWGTMLQGGRLWVRVPRSLIFNPWVRQRFVIAHTVALSYRLDGPGPIPGSSFFLVFMFCCFCVCCCFPVFCILYSIYCTLYSARCTVLYYEILWDMLYFREL
jgi:hypothetical protein